MEYKSAKAEFKASSTDEGRYEGYFAIIGNLDDGKDIIDQGAFNKTLLERASRIKVFFGHDWSKLIGPPPETIREDATGLYAQGKLTLDSMWGKEAWALMKDQALTEGSIGYDPVRVEFQKDDGSPVGNAAEAAWRDDVIRRIKELTLYEISPVPLGMNPLTSVRAVKGLDGLRDYAEMMRRLTTDLKEGRVLSAASKEKVRGAVDAMKAAMDALNELLAAADPDGDKARQGAAQQRASAVLQRMRATGLALTIK